jgi:23S rRNA (cytidine1920-2'-O)/16S rRNA (cytidine1409-2'-O)-methyltransferase
MRMNDSPPPTPPPPPPTDSAAAITPDSAATKTQATKPLLTKQRLDQLLLARGLVDSRAQAQAMIMAGQVQVGGQVVTKAGQQTAFDAEIDLRQPPPLGQPWRVEIGARPGSLWPGSDRGGGVGYWILHRWLYRCAAGAGAVRVYAIDVGRGQLAWRLRQDPRVVVREGVNARYLSEDDVPELVDWLVADVSFISLTLALPAALSRLKPGGQLVALIKPQFELSPRDIEKGGVVRDPQRRQQAIDRITDWLSGLQLHGCRFALQGTIASPILRHHRQSGIFVGRQSDPKLIFAKPQFNRALKLQQRYFGPGCP